MRNKLNLALLAMSLGSLIACKKDPGSGGTSAITGQVTGRIYDVSGGGGAEAEVTQITVPNGNDIEDGEYILLNTPGNGTYYYIWFDWNNGVAPDPGLSGRTAIPVVYNFNESNLTVAANISNAVQTVAGTDFTVVVQNDIVILTNKATGEVPDAEEQTANISIDIANQGKSATGGSSTYYEGPIADERVYLIYGEEEYFAEDTRTDAEGRFQFRGLNRGDYTIYVLSEDTLMPKGVLNEVQRTVTIEDKKEVVDAGNLFVIHL